MLTAVVQHSEELVAFITALNIVLYQPQIRHLFQMVDALLTCNDPNTISGMYRLLKGQPDPKSGADFLRESLWEPEDIGSLPKRSGKYAHRGIIPDRKSIDERPIIVEQRQCLGDWKGDLIIGKNHRDAALTLI